MGILVKFQLNISHQELNLSSVGSKIWMKVVSKNNHGKNVPYFGSCFHVSGLALHQWKTIFIEICHGSEIEIKIKKVCTRGLKEMEVEI